MFIRPLLAAVLTVLLSLAGCDARAADKEEISAIYDQLDQCNNNKDGTGVLTVFTKASFPRYEPLIKIALDGTPEQVRALPPTDRTEVLRMRLRATRAELAGLNGMEYTRFATGRGWYVSPDGGQVQSTLTRFRFNKTATEATAELVSDGERSGMRFRFIKEDDYWKYDEPFAIELYDRDLRRAARDEGVSEEQFILDLLEEEIGKEVPATVWEPMP